MLHLATLRLLLIPHFSLFLHLPFEAVSLLLLSELVCFEGFWGISWWTSLPFAFTLTFVWEGASRSCLYVELTSMFLPFVKHVRKETLAASAVVLVDAI